MAPIGTTEPTPATRPRDRAMSRREMFRAGALAAGFWGGAGASVRPVETHADADPGAVLTRLARRITMGANEAELALANSLGFQAYLERHLDHLNIPEDPALLTRLFGNGQPGTGLTTLTMAPVDLYALPAGQVRGELSEACLLRAALSTRQLFERMVEFWTDHFNIDHLNGDDAYLKTPDDRDVIRQHALGSFPALLDASAHSPAMLYYLDNNASVAGNPNENYARELMELHSMGVDGGYTQADVLAVARCFTGWTLFGRSTTNPQSGLFRYNSAVHDTGSKTIFAGTSQQVVIPPRSAAAGIQDGLDVLSALAHHPSTAAFISRKLCKRFIGEDCHQSVIDSVAAAYTSTNGDIKAMLRAALTPANLYDARPRYKRPFHLVVSALRALPVTIGSTNATFTLLGGAGHRPFLWGPPDGYPDTLDYWSGLIIPRWNFGAQLLTNASGNSGGITGLTVDVASFFAGLTTADQMVARIDQALFAGEMPQAQRDRVRDYLAAAPASNPRRRDAIGLAIGAPEFQWY